MLTQTHTLTCSLTHTMQVFTTKTKAEELERFLLAALEYFLENIRQLQKAPQKKIKCQVQSQEIHLCLIIIMQTKRDPSHKGKVGELFLRSSSWEGTLSLISYFSVFSLSNTSPPNQSMMMTLGHFRFNRESTDILQYTYVIMI